MNNRTNQIPNYFLTIVCAVIIITGCVSPDTVERHALDVIPEPVSEQVNEGRFSLNRETSILVDPGMPELQRMGTMLAELVNSATWFNLKVRPDNRDLANSIRLRLDPDSAAYENDEAYALVSDENGITITAPDEAGIFYGIQTLRQLLPPEIEHTDPTLVPQHVEWSVPAVEINDHPRFSYRGMHLDVGRHLFPVDFIKKYIDMIAMYKMNRFHWHLTEDQGWRIEIKKYPRLTEVGAWRDSTLVGHYGSEVYDGERYGGYYTQEEIREIVAYAQERQITIIPEIEMPGHSSAALAAYPQFGCFESGEYSVQTQWGIYDNVYCPTEETFRFLEDVLTEVMALFPSEYIHIGGDEAPKAQWERSPVAQQVIEREGLEDEHELQSYFITRIEEFLNENGRQIIGWDEILEGGLAPNATVMSWRGMEGGIAAARQNHEVVMTPTSHLYLDYYQADPGTEPLAIGGFTTLEKTYSFEPVPEVLTGREAQYILGAQGNVWTEYIKSPKKAAYMAFPRALAVSEITWTPRNKKNFTLFWRRLQSHFDRFDIMGVNAARHYEGTMPLLRNE
ncbi:MAG: beta-N-acetylhexosaminidase [Balneolaceae bacterium]|nr:beta-N-acetylhexosaminidase [Balneolaceae bacterium]